MRLGKKEAAGYVADIETDEIPDVAALPGKPEAVPAAESAAREPEKAAVAS